MDNEIPIEDQFDVTVSEWLQKSAGLKTYIGVEEYCEHPDYQESVNQILGRIHQFDSMILEVLNDPDDYLRWNPKEEKKTIKDVTEMESDYKVVDFIAQMNSTCSYRTEIELKADKLKKRIGMESYDGQILLLETDLRRYLDKIDRLLLRIDDHLHILHIDY